MPNRIAGRPWVLDTAQSLPVWTGWIKIAHFEFSGYAAAGDKALITDKNGFLVWQATGIDTLEDQDSFKISWVNGLIPQQIDSGQVVVYIE